MISSWLLRIALRNGMKPQSFCKLLWPNRSFWNHSIDRYASQDLLEDLSRCTATPLQTLQKHSLAAYKGILFADLIRNGNTPWVLPLGIFHRRFRRTGLSFCPECLATGEPYFRRRWRLSLATLCLIHKRPLLDGCSVCHEPLQPHRIDMGSKNPYTSAAVFRCSACSFDLRSARSSTLTDLWLWKSESASDQFLTATPCEAARAMEYFSVLRHLLFMLTSRRSRLTPFRTLAASAIPSPLVESWKKDDETSLGFDAMRIDVRRVFIGAAYWLLEDWPRRFLDLACAARLRGSDLTRDFPSMPTSFAVVAANLPARQNELVLHQVMVP
ncbi:hypothetical protein AciX9_1002 [Granulicella tundricola MP5ACTX9]|uniref:TniQ domain-containing protein n=1 Tax=Granulicella tundricola (strain ATCC BAA-1859 / DSM 23138 / MP5ACTX9) TaxID=1198114 RepID=E8X2D6_GRATM|nr:hypothetical protein AciX9_1002 [Granulicella tundricola MP5ACTX9]